MGQQNNPQISQIQKMPIFKEMRNEKKIKKMSGISTGQKVQEPRVIADEPLDDDDEESPEKISINDAGVFQQPSIGPSSNKANGETFTNNVFARLNQHAKGKSLLGSFAESA